MFKSNNKLSHYGSRIKERTGISARTDAVSVGSVYALDFALARITGDVVIRRVNEIISRPHYYRSVSVYVSYDLHSPDVL